MQQNQNTYNPAIQFRWGYTFIMLTAMPYVETIINYASGGYIRIPDNNYIWHFQM